MRLVGASVVALVVLALVPVAGVVALVALALSAIASLIGLAVVLAVAPFVAFLWWCAEAEPVPPTPWEFGRADRRQGVKVNAADWFKPHGDTLKAKGS